MAGSAVWVYSMVVLGGVTRLTRSGLSMTDWKFTGKVAVKSGLGVCVGLKNGSAIGRLLMTEWKFTLSEFTVNLDLGDGVILSLCT